MILAVLLLGRSVYLKAQDSTAQHAYTQPIGPALLRALDSAWAIRTKPAGQHTGNDSLCKRMIVARLRTLVSTALLRYEVEDMLFFITDAPDEDDPQCMYMLLGDQSQNLYKYRASFSFPNPPGLQCQKYNGTPAVFAAAVAVLQRYDNRINTCNHLLFVFHQGRAGWARSTLLQKIAFCSS